MKLWLVAACILCISLPVALGLKCYTCSSSKSWDDCKSTRKSLPCAGDADRCAKVHLKYGGVEIFAKHCVPNALCKSDTNPTCKKATGSSECEVDCCTGDNCNAGSAFRVSGILLLTCALVSLMMLDKA
ncbi:uncharacterized protein LOC144641013 [Oculina patagonica]